MTYRALNKNEQECEQVLGVNGATTMPLGIGTIQIKVEDDLNELHIIHLYDVHHLPEAPVNIFVPQVFIQQ